MTWHSFYKINSQKLTIFLTNISYYHLIETILLEMYNYI